MLCGKRVNRTATHFDKFTDRHNFKTEFTQGAVFEGRYDFPKLKKTQSIPENPIPFNTAKSNKNPAECWVHFFIDDYQFERLWNTPNKYLPMLKRFKGVITADYSMYGNMPKVQQMWNCYRNRAVAYWLQNNGIDIVPVVEWADYGDFEWCLDGLPKESTLALEIYGCRKNSKSRYGLIKGIERVCSQLSPSCLVIYGNEIKSVNSLCKNVIWLENYCNIMRKRL